MGADSAPDPSNWDPIKALQTLSMEHALDSSVTPQARAKKLFEENLPLSVMSICHIAVYGDSEAMRFNAARFVVERTMGPAERVGTSVDGRHAWDAIYEQVTNEAESYLGPVEG